MNKKRIILSSIVIWIVGTAYGMLTCAWLFNWVYQIPPNIWKTPEEIMTTANFLGANAVGLGMVILFTLVFAILYKGIPKQGVNKGLVYGLLVWLVGALPGIATMSFYMTIATTVVVYWIISGLLNLLIMGAIVGAIYKEK